MSLADRIAVMSKGQIEQLDSPSTIYAHPQSLFVADFIGAMNLLPATPNGNKLQFGAQTLSAPESLSSHAANSSVTVAIRPEDLAIVDSANGHHDAWKGSVDQLMDMGHYRKALVNVADVGRLKVYLSKSLPISEGDPVALSPLRYLVYQDSQPPIEVNRQPEKSVLAYN